MSNNNESSIRGEGAPVPADEMQVQPLSPAPLQGMLWLFATELMMRAFSAKHLEPTEVQCPR